ncbi:MAG: hypothetical protein AB7P00_38235, partial [Sandaracinaceae bacterium]
MHIRTLTGWGLSLAIFSSGCAVGGLSYGEDAGELTSDGGSAPSDAGARILASCGSLAQLCCEDDTCHDSLVCNAAGRCDTCGLSGETCCPGAVACP